MARDVSDVTPVESRDDLVSWIASGEKPRAAWRIGTEHEKIPFAAGAEPVAYDGDSGIRALLEGLSGVNGWEPIVEDGRPIGLTDDANGGAISLEPGGQFELSGAPLLDAHETNVEANRHFDELRRVATPLGIRFLDFGMSPLWSRAETPVMPKRRYEIMAGYMPKVGTRGLDMMFRTATVQANVDFGSERDMLRKLRLSLSLQPIATALFANSPFTEGRPNGFVSMRSEIWRDTDRQRTGMLAWAFEEGAGYERYVDWALDVPLYFVKRGDVYHDVSGASFRDLLSGRLERLPGERATLSDWANHASTLFPEVRLKRYLEMRGADMGPRDRIPALAAFWAGLLYDEVALDAGLDVVSDWTAGDRETLRADVPRLGLAANVAGRDAAAVAREILAIAAAGLARRARLDGTGQDESIYLAPLQEIAERGETLAETRLALFHGRWAGSVVPSFQECAL